MNTTQAETAIVQIIRELMPHPDVPIVWTALLYTDLGLDQLSLSRLVIRLEDTFALTFPECFRIGDTTVGSVITTVLGLLAGRLDDN